MLHTTALTSLPATSLSISTQRALEVASLTPATPATGIALLDVALEACVLVQTGLLATIPAFLPMFSTGAGSSGATGLAWAPQSAQLGAASTRQFDAAWVFAALVGAHQLGHAAVVSQAAWIVESADLWLLVAELAAVSWGVLVVTVGGGLWLRSQVGYDAIVTLCQQRGLSAAEIFSLVTFVVGYLVFDVFVIMAEDDMLEAISYMFGGIIAAALILLAIAVDVQYYFMISAISGGEATLRIFYTDIVNNGLCLLRVFFC
jgi:hypothetical protein